MFRGRILAVNAEVAHAQELELSRSGSALEHLFKLAARENLERVGVEAAYIILVRSVRIGISAFSRGRSSSAMAKISSGSQSPATHSVMFDGA